MVGTQVSPRTSDARSLVLADDCEASEREMGSEQTVDDCIVTKPVRWDEEEVTQEADEPFEAREEEKLHWEDV